MNELDVALEAAGAAAAILSNRGAGPLRVDHKGAIDLVTEVDLACERAVRDVLFRHLPDVPVLGEEGGGAADQDTRWVVDPLDGTTNFVHGFPMYAVSVALEIDGRSEVGVIIDPIRQRTYRAQRGHGAWCGDERLAVSTCRDLDTSLLATGFPYDRRTAERADFYLAYVKAFLMRTQGVRRAGAAAMDLVMVAAGQLDGFWEFTLSPWDVAAGRLLVEEAGGRVTAHDRGPLERLRPSPLASNGWLHDAMHQVLADVSAATPP